MNNEDLTVLGSDPLVARDGATDPPGAEDAAEPLHAGRAPTEAFARALKAAVERASKSLGRAEPGWGLIPDVAGLLAGHAPPGGGPPTEPTATTRCAGSAGATPDLNALSPAIGALLAAEPAGPHEARPSEGGNYHFEAVAPAGTAAGAGADSLAAGAGTRQTGPGARGPVDRNQGLPAAPGGPLIVDGAWPAGANTGHPGLTGLITLAASAGVGRDGEGLMVDTGRNTGTALPDRWDGAVALPGVNPVADQLAFTPGAPAAAGVSPYSVEIPESTLGSSAFGPVLSGALAPGPGYDGSPGLASVGADEGGGRASDYWAGLPSPEGADPAGGPAVDLSRTNELLQQLLDEVRRGRQPFLPINDRNTSL